MTLTEYRDVLRNYLKDYEGLNRLLNFKEENEDADLDMYLKMALGQVNFISPIIKTWDFDAFPFPALIINQATIECLISNGIVSARNELEYNNGGVVVRVPRGDKYVNSINALMRNNAQMLQAFAQWKIAKNLEAAYGLVHSPYALLEEGYLKNQIL